MQSRIGYRFKEIIKAGKKAMIPYITAGVISLDESIELALKLEDTGADFLEIGIPFSDPVADGPIIQRASEFALKNGINTEDSFKLAHELRKRSSISIIFMVYYNCVFRYGIEKFSNACADAGVDGLIVPDLPFEESQELSDSLVHLPIDLIRLATPSSKDRLNSILNGAAGFVYCVSTLGVTGERKYIDDGLSEFLNDVAKATVLPRAVGFGISSREQVLKVRENCEGVIIGSALMRRVMDSGLYECISFISGIRDALDVD